MQSGGGPSAGAGLVPHATTASTSRRIRYNGTMSEERTAIERTRALLTRRLGIELAIAQGDAYREANGLTGDWIGAFAQPGVLLNAATPVQVTLGDGHGHGVDEYGESTFMVKQDGDRVELRKSYAGRSLDGQFTYVGRLSDGVLAGYWYSPLRPAFCGVFWLARTDRIAETTRTALGARVRKRSIKLGLLLVLVAVLSCTFAFSVLGYPRLALAIALLCLGFRYLLVQRTDTMRREAQLWKRDLG